MARRKNLAFGAVAIGLACSLALLATEALGFVRTPFVEKALFRLHDFAVRSRSSGNETGMPPSLLALFDNGELRAEIRSRGRIPPSLPPATIAAVVERALAARIPLVVLDIDFAMDRSAPDEAALVAALQAWARDPKAGALLLVRGDGCGARAARCPRIRTPYDPAVAEAGNIAWTSVSTEPHFDGVLRQVDLLYRRAGHAAEPRSNPYVAHLAADVWRSFIDAPPEVAAERARSRITRYSNCRDSGRPWNACLDLRSGARAGAVTMLPAARLPSSDDLSEEPEAYRHRRLNALSISTFLRPSDDDWRKMPLFVGASHFRITDRFATSVGEMPGVVIVAATAANWAGNGIPRTPGIAPVALLALLWGALITWVVLYLERRLQDNRGPFGARSPALARILGVIGSTRFVLTAGTLVFFLVAARVAVTPESWAAIVVTSAILGVVLDRRQVRAFLIGGTP